MTSLTAEYRSRLHATKQSRRNRKSEDRRTSGPVDVDDFYVPASPTSQSRRRSKTPQPIVNSGFVQQQQHASNERRSQSAPRSVSKQQSTFPLNNLQWADNSEAGFCFQPGRRRLDVHNGRNDKGERIDLRIPKNHAITGTVSTKTQSANKLASNDPREYAASYYAKKIGVHRGDARRSSRTNVDTHDALDDTKSRHTHQTVTRSMSQKMADCLQLSNKSLYLNDSTDDKKHRKSKTTSNPLTSLCFVDNMDDTSHDTIDITTIDVHSFDGCGPNVSALHDNSPFRSVMTNTYTDKNMSDTNTRTTTTTKQRHEDSSTNQTANVTNSSSSDNEDENEEDNYDTISPEDSVLRPPKVLSVRKNTTSESKQQLPPKPSSPFIQVNPDDYDYSYRKKSNIDLPHQVDLDCLSDVAIHTFPEVTGLIEPQMRQRDLQRRPRGMFEHITSMDDDDINDDEIITTLSTPYDESAAKAYQIARGSGGVPDEANELEYEQSLLEIRRQRKALLTVENQLKDTVLELEATKNDLQKSKENSTERSRTYADATTRIVQERLDSDEKLQTELKANERLKEDVDCLKREVINLSLELERAVHRNNWSDFQIVPDLSIRAVENSLADDLSTTSNRSDSHPVKTTDLRPTGSPIGSNTLSDEATKALEFMSEKLQASQREVTEMQSKLTATQAACELYKMTTEQLQRERDTAIEQKVNVQRDLLLARAKICENDTHLNLYEQEMRETTRLKEAIVSLTKDLNNSNIRASDYATTVQSLEEELVRAQLSAAKYEMQALSLERELNLPKENVNVKALPTNKNSTTVRSLEFMFPKAEQPMERPQIEEELTQMFALHNHPPNGVSLRCNDEINLTNRGSSDLLDILRKKLDPSA